MIRTKSNGIKGPDGLADGHRGFRDASFSLFSRRRLVITANKYKPTDDVKVGRKQRLEVEQQMPILNDNQANELRLADWSAVGKQYPTGVSAS